MSFGSTIRIAALCAIVATGPTAGAASAATCSGERCANSATSKTEGEPLRLKKFMRQPVATSATRAVKKGDGSYAQAAPARRAKPRPVTAREKSNDVAPEAAQAFASEAEAQVRVVGADEVNEIDLAADDAPLVPISVSTKLQNSVQVVEAQEINSIDRAADAVPAVARDPSATGGAASEPRTDGGGENASWIQRMLFVLGGAFAAAATAARFLFA